MKLINDFFEVIALTPSEGELRCKVKFNPEHFIYKAHFPGNPVTPGVCLVQMAAEILGEQYHKTFMLSQLKNIRFKKIVEPGDEPTFVFTKLVFDETQFSAQVSIEDEEAQYVKMSLLYHHSDI